MGYKNSISQPAWVSTVGSPVAAPLSVTFVTSARRRRLLATRLGSAGADLIADGVFGVMVASRGDGTAPVPLEEVAGKRRLVPIDHSWVQTARHLGVCLGDE